MLAPDGDGRDLVSLCRVESRPESGDSGNRRGELHRLLALLGRELENLQFRSRLALRIRFHLENDFICAAKRLHAGITVVLQGET